MFNPHDYAFQIVNSGKTKVNLVRCAGDFIITANTKELAEELKVVGSEFWKGNLF